MNNIDSKSLDCSVGISTGCRLDDRGLGSGAGNFSLLHRVQTGSEARPASYPMGTGGSFPGGKAAGARGWPLTSCRGQRIRGAIPPSPNTSARCDAGL